MRIFLNYMTIRPVGAIILAEDMFFMKKFIFVFAALLCLAGCAQDSDDGNSSSSSQNVVWSKTESETTKEVLLITKSEDGMSSKSVVYKEVQSDGEGMLFGVMKMTSGSDTLYKGSVQLKGNSAFSDGDYDRYSISIGSSVSLSNPIGGATVEDGNYLYMIVGSLSLAQISLLKNANSVTTSIWKSTDAENTTKSVTVDYEFIKALIKYF